jgi:hypothetical protein
MDEMQIDEDANSINLDNNEIIISELLSQYEDSIQKGIYIDVPALIAGNINPDKRSSFNRIIFFIPE